VTDQRNHTPARGHLPVAPILFDPEPIAGWSSDCAWRIAGVDIGGPEPLVFLCYEDVSSSRWFRLAQCERDYSPMAPWFVDAIRRGEHPMAQSAAVEARLDRIRALMRDGHELNLRRQLAWIGFREGEVFALQTLGSKRGDPSYLALCRSIDEAVTLSAEEALVAQNRWGKLEPIPHQGVYVVGNRLVGRVDEMFAPGSWQIMPEGVITDARIVSRREMYLDLDTQRRDEHGNPVDLPISATREELHKTIARAVEILTEIVAALAAIGVDRPQDVVAFMMSGNGVQLWFALADIPESAELHAVIRELLAIWSAFYDSAISHVDTGVHDAKRIGPLGGTMKRKGLKTDLYRRVTFDCAADPRRLTLPELRALAGYYRSRLTQEQRSAVGKMLGVRPTPPKSRPAGRVGSGLSACNEIPIRDVAAKLGIDRDKPTCPSCESGGSGSDVVFLDDVNLLNCKHARCSARPNRTPVDLVAQVVFGCDNIAGTKGIAGKVLGWFQTNFGVGGRS
jgi:hypothetical protein